MKPLLCQHGDEGGRKRYSEARNPEAVDDDVNRLPGVRVEGEGRWRDVLRGGTYGHSALHGNEFEE